jgi:hypothetical protein
MVSVLVIRKRTSHSMGGMVVVVEVVVVTVVEGAVELVEPGTVVVVPPTVVVVTVVDDVVVPLHGQSSVTSCPTADFRHSSASLANVGRFPLGAQMHSGVHIAVPTATRKMNRQSDAVGLAPFVTGWLQSPRSARAGVAA